MRAALPPSLIAVTCRAPAPQSLATRILKNLHRGNRSFASMAPPIRPTPEILHSCTLARWICNDEAERYARRTPFNVDALERVACRSVSAQSCTSWNLLGEGSFNRNFLLQFDNGATAVVRIPFIIAGNPKWLVASEVATIAYVRDRWLENNPLGMPMPPKVLAWDTTYANPAQTPYMILDYVPGVPVGARWSQIYGDYVRPFLNGLCALEDTLLSHPFSQYGSLYFSTDVPPELRSSNLYPDPDSTCDDPLDKELSSKYCIGPSAHRNWWRWAYGDVNANRGPWQDVKSMICSAAELVLRAMDSVVDLSSPFVASNPSDAALLRRLLQGCIRVAPLIIPRDPAITRPVLNHPDLALGNIIVPPEGPAHIESVIDWQGATIDPYYMQSRLPTGLIYSDGVIAIEGGLPQWPSNFDDLTPEEQEVVRIHHRYACRQVYYHERQMYPLKPRGKVWRRICHIHELDSLPAYILRCVADGPHDLQGLLIYLQQRWDDITGDPCPLDFTPDEIAAYEAKQKDRAEYRTNINRLRLEVGIMQDGSVPSDAYEGVKQALEQRRKDWDETAMKGPFPYGENGYSEYLT